MSAGNRIVLGITGSIAAYKAAEIIRLLTKAGVDVHCILTRSGAEFITPLTLGTLSGNPVTTEMFADPTGGPYTQWGQGGSPSGEPGGQGVTPAGGIRHIQVSRESNLIVVAPASGNILGKVAHGIADDSLSTAIMASSAPVLFAPAMNTRMWENPAVRDNVRLLADRGYLFVQPGTGDLACGEMGTGRMADPSEIVGAALRLLADPARPRVLVTAGRTEEAVDPVRFLSNRSSGRMGCAIAEAARHAGYPVTLICGPMSVEAPAGVEVVRVVSAREMLEALHQREGEHEILIMAAAVADYRPAEVSPEKLPGGRERHSLELVANPDILASLRGRRDGRVTIGFALETGDGTQRAREKLRVKGCDLIVLNHPLRPGSEFGGDTNEVTFLYRDGRMEPLPLMSKLDVGREILARAEIIRAGAARSTQGKAERQP